MLRVARWSSAIVVALLGLLHVQFSIPNFLFSGECAGHGLRWLASCTVFHEALLSLLAGVALLTSAALLLLARPILASAVALAGTVPLALFFWLVAIPTGLSDMVFGYMSLPAPVAALVSSLLMCWRMRLRPLNRTPSTS